MRVMMSKGMARFVLSDRRWLGRLAGVVVTAFVMLASYPAISAPAYEAIVLDAQTGQVLRELSADTPTPPASLTKMMTLYLAFEALNQGRLRLDQYLPVSSEAASKSPTKLHLVPGDSIPVHDLILGVVTKSANDAAAVLADRLAVGGDAVLVNLASRDELGNHRRDAAREDPQSREAARPAKLAKAVDAVWPRRKPGPRGW